MAGLLAEGGCHHALQEEAREELRTAGIHRPIDGHDAAKG